MMAISNFADWLTPTNPPTNEAAAEPDAIDQTQDFASLLAASYLAPPAQTTPIAVPSTAAEMIAPTAPANTVPRAVASQVSATDLPSAARAEALPPREQPPAVLPTSDASGSATNPPSLLTVAGSYKKQDIARALLDTYQHLNHLKQLWSDLHD